MHRPVHGQLLLEEAVNHGLMVKAGQETHRLEQEGPVGALSHGLHAAVEDVQDFWHLKGRRWERTPQCLLSPYLSGTQAGWISA